MERHLKAIWNLGDHVPAVHARPYRDYIPSDDEATMLGAEYPVQSFGIFDLPSWFAALNPAEKLRRAGKATLDTVSVCAPLFHRSLVAGRILVAEGTTIMVTARGRPQNGHRGIIAVPWSAGEDWSEVLKRFMYRRAVGQPRLSPAEMVLARAYLPVWQAVVSVVEQPKPLASLMGSGGSTPTEVCIGRDWVCFTSEHALFTPDDGMLFTDWFFTFLDADR